MLYLCTISWHIGLVHPSEVADGTYDRFITHDYYWHILWVHPSEITDGTYYGLITHDLRMAHDIKYG
jgi:hypothetical protein